jgi:hypothetical protein
MATSLWIASGCALAMTRIRKFEDLKENKTKQ